MTTEWERPSERLLGLASPEPFTDLTGHLWPPVKAWIESVLDSVPLAHLRVAGLQLHVALDGYEYRWLEGLVDAAERNPATALNLVEWVLRGMHVWARGDERAAERYRRTLDLYLRAGGSAFMVAPDGCSLTWRVDETTAAAVELAMSPDDQASAELAKAWATAFGRAPDPAVAWQSAIRAVEDLLIPIVEPNNRQATLGSARGVLRANAQRWQVDHPKITLDVLLKALTDLGYEPRRHGGQSEETVPSLADAQAAVHLAVLLVNWLRAGLLRTA